MSAHWLTIRNEADSAEILIQGQIGKGWFDDSGMSQQEFTDALSKVPKDKPVVVGINSEGGSIQDGLGIYNAIKARGNVTTRIDGYALSIASVIALAGNKIVSPLASVWMIHDPWAFAQGNEDDMRKAADMLAKNGDVIAAIYADRTKRSKEETRSAMRAETWFTGEEAKAWGLADEAIDRPVTLTGIKNLYKRMPEPIRGLEPGIFACISQPFSAFRMSADEGGKEPPRLDTTTQGNHMDANASNQAQAAPAPTPPSVDLSPVITAIGDGNARINQTLTTVADGLAALVKHVTPPAPPAPAAGADPLPISPVKANPEDEIAALADRGPRIQLAHICKNRAKLRQAMNANTFTNMTNTVLARLALEAFVTKLAPLSAFSTNFSAEAVQRGDKVKVLFVSAASAPTTFTGSYTMQSVTAEGKDITINKRPYVSWSITTDELATQPQLEMERFARQKGNALAKYVLQDVWSLVTATNYGDTEISNYTVENGDKVTVTAANFDSDEVALISHGADWKEWPDEERALILGPGYWNALLNDTTTIGSDALEYNTALRERQMVRYLGFTIYKTTAVPDNSENLEGFAANPDAILVAMRTLIPEANVANRPTVQTLSDGETGISIVMREWFAPDDDATKRVLECNYGYAVGNGEGIVRIESA